MMSVVVADPTSLSGYQLQLPGFEGPLDVLLRLIERNQLAITDVSLVAVTDQFLAYLANIDDAPATTFADFAAVGSRLVLLKSRSLLPRPVTDDDAEPEDLVQQLVAYRTMKAAAAHLAVEDQRGAGAFAKGESIVLPDAPPPRLALHQAASLARALRRRLTNVAQAATPVTGRPRVTLAEMTERLLVALSTTWCLEFSVFRRRCNDQNEVLVAFLGVLTLVRRRVIEVEQTELFGAITMRQTPRMIERRPLPSRLGNDRMDE